MDSSTVTHLWSLLLPLAAPPSHSPLTELAPRLCLLVSASLRETTTLDLPCRVQVPEPLSWPCPETIIWDSHSAGKTESLETRRMK